MTCPKCQCQKFKPFDDGTVCFNCGKFIPAPVVIEMTRNVKQKCYQNLPEGEPIYRPSNKYRITTFIDKNYNKIQKKLLQGNSWNQIKAWLIGLDAPGVPEIKTVKKYYLMEYERRANDAKC